MAKLNYIPVFLFACFLTVSFLFGYTPLLIAVLYLVFSALTYWAYSRDKQAAKNGTWRVSESTLHYFSVIGGWPGAIVAQQTLRHKTVKADFRGMFWMTALVNFGGLIWLHTKQGAPYLHKLTYEVGMMIAAEFDSGNLRSALLMLLGY